VLERLRGWREIAPDITIRSTFVVGFPGETEEDFQYLLDWLDEAQLDRVGAFRFEPVEGASANLLPDPVPEEVKEERYARIMEKTAAISAAKLQAKIGRTLEVIIDEVGDDGATGRSQADAPEIDGEVFLRDAGHLKQGDIVKVDDRGRRRARSLRRAARFIVKSGVPEGRRLPFSEPSRSGLQPTRRSWLPQGRRRTPSRR
jgi:ribosomal protein S12 methylthiotransferase